MASSGVRGTAQSLLSALPKELWMHVLAFLTIPQLARTMAVSSEFAALTLKTIFSHFQQLFVPGRKELDDTVWGLTLRIHQLKYRGLPELYDGYSDSLWSPVTSKNLPTRSIKFALKDIEASSDWISAILGMDEGPFEYLVVRDPMPRGFDFQIMLALINRPEDERNRTIHFIAQFRVEPDRN